MQLAAPDALLLAEDSFVGREPRPSTAWTGWRFAAGVDAATFAFCAFLSFFLPAILGDHQWISNGDAWWTVKGAQWVSHGAIGTVYYGDPMYLPLPGMLVLLAPVTALGDHLGLVTNSPFRLPEPSMWLLVGPTFFLFGSASLLGIDYLAETIAVPIRRRRGLLIAVGATVVPATCVWAAHPEDLLALGLSCTSMALLLRRRYLGAALVLSLGVMMQPWALLLVPALVGASPREWRLRVLAWSVALPGACAALLFALDPSDTFRALGMQPMLGRGQRLPWWHLTRPMVIPVPGGPVAARVGSLSRSASVIVAVGAGVVTSRFPGRKIFLAAASVALLSRGFFETQFWPFYVAPAAVLMAVTAGTAERRRFTVASLAAFGVYALSAGGYASFSMNAWLALLLLAALGYAAVAAPLGARRDRSGSPGADFVTADGYLAETLDSLDSAVNYARWIHDLARPHLGRRVLEVGAGHGTMTALLSDDGRSVVATDLSERCTDVLRRRFSTSGDVSVITGDLDRVAGEGLFDSALLVNVLEHIEDDSEAVRRLAESIRPGGALVVWVPAHPALYSRFDHNVGHHRRYRSKEMRRILADAGLEVTELRQVNMVGAVAWWTLAKVLRRDPSRPSGVQAFDRLAVPVIRRIEAVIRVPFGQSILAVAIRP